MTALNSGNLNLRAYPASEGIKNGRTCEFQKLFDGERLFKFRCMDTANECIFKTYGDSGKKVCMAITKN